MTDKANGRPSPAQLIEAVLLVSPRPIPPKDLLSATGLTRAQADGAVAELRGRYAPDLSGIVLREVAGGYLFSTNPSCAAAVERFREEARPAPLSGAAHEVLACALYLGPLTRGSVSRVRGVNSDAVVRSLIERNLIAEVGSDRDAPGTPALLAVTDDFLAATDAAAHDDFPDLESLVSPEELARVRERLTSESEPSPEAPASAPPSEEEEP